MMFSREETQEPISTSFDLDLDPFCFPSVSTTTKGTAGPDPSNVSQFASHLQDHSAGQNDSAAFGIPEIKPQMLQHVCGSHERPDITPDSLITGFFTPADYVSRESSSCFSPMLGNAGYDPFWRIDEQEPCQYRWQSHGYMQGEAADSFASPFAAQGVQAAGPSHKQAYISQPWASQVHQTGMCEGDLNQPAEIWPPLQMLERHSAPPQLAAGPHKAAQATAVDWATLMDKESLQIASSRERGEPEHQDLNQLLPLGYNACGRARRGSSLRSWENTVKPYKRARKSEHDAQCQGSGPLSFRPRSKSDSLRIVSGRGDFHFPAWKPHDDRPMDRKFCLKVRSNRFSDPLQPLSLDDSSHLLPPLVKKESH